MAEYESDLREAIEKFDLIEFLDNNNIEYKLEGKNIGPDWIGINPCPLCGDTRYHAAIHKESKTLSCWVCSPKDIWLGDVISLFLNCSKKEAIEQILECLPERSDDIEEVVKGILKKTDNKKISSKHDKNTSIKMPLSVRISRQLIKSHHILEEFLDKRMLRLSDISEYNIRLGVDGRYKNRIIIPIYNNRKLIGFQTRHLVHKIYLNEGNIHSYIFMPERINPKYPLLIVEGILDYINTYKFLQRFFKGKMNLTTAFSKKLTPEQINLINSLGVSLVIFMLDGDSWFDYHSSCKNLNCSNTDFIILPKDKDPGMLKQKEFLRIFNDYKKDISKSYAPRVSTSLL